MSENAVASPANELDFVVTENDLPPEEFACLRTTIREELSQGLLRHSGLCHTAILLGNRRVGCDVTAQPDLKASTASSAQKRRRVQPLLISTDIVQPQVSEFGRMPIA